MLISEIWMFKTVFYKFMYKKYGFSSPKLGSATQKNLLSLKTVRVWLSYIRMERIPYIS
ncbi:hypothetical protein D3C81_2247720 [compost metagenome]